MLKIAAAFLCLICLSFAAHAADNTGDSAGGTYQESLSGRVLTVPGSAVISPADVNSQSMISSGIANPGMGVAVGWQPMESLRLELEYAARNRDGAVLAPTADGDIGSVSLMANALFDVKVTDWLMPYVGLGVGWTRLESERLMAGLGSGNRGETFTYQGIVGLNVPFSRSLSFFADGRYLRSGDFSYTAIDEFPAHNAQSWTALAGIRFTFGK